MVGRFSEEIMNDNEKRLIEICGLNKLNITNSNYKHNEIHQYRYIQGTSTYRYKKLGNLKRLSTTYYSGMVLI